MKIRRILIAAPFMIAVIALGQDNGVLGNWKNPTGSIINIYRCGNDVCARLVEVRKDAPSRVDNLNPKPALRKRSLCGLQIGTGFRLAAPGRAEGGELYDPQSGRTYSGSMTRDGEKLKLRGYIGIALFGRTEVWTRAPDAVPPCRP
ncbi:MAG TPA: DUF2147 domain-containing protein [Silvibacterium sp.]|nr:DUF2147 domain-containing protein [Silvibacterium sp.]